MEEVAVPQGWQAQLDLEYSYRGGKTRMTRKRQSGPLSVQRAFYPEGDICHNYLLHPPGGLVGGDYLQFSVLANHDAHALLTAPGATKYYRSKLGQHARQDQRIDVRENAILEWLPQQNIFFNGASAVLETDIHIAAGAKFVGWEMHCYGRPSAEDPFLEGSVASKTRVSVAGELRLIEQFATVDDDALQASTGLRGLAMQGCLIAAPCDLQQKLALEQILLNERGPGYGYPVGLTLVDEVLIVRALGQQAEPMHQLFTRLWAELRGEWLGKSACPPRIWAT